MQIKRNQSSPLKIEQKLKTLASFDAAAQFKADRDNGRKDTFKVAPLAIVLSALKSLSIDTRSDSEEVINFAQGYQTDFRNAYENLVAK